MSRTGSQEPAAYHTRRILFETTGISVVDFRCLAHVETEGAEELNPSHSIVFIRRGIFRRTYRGERLIADANHILFFNEAQPYRYAHPLAGGDDCTILALAPELLRELIGRHAPWDVESPEIPFRLGHGPNTPKTAKLHYELLALVRRRAPSLSIEDLLSELSDEAIGAAYSMHALRTERESQTPVARRKHREMVEAVKLALNENFESPPKLGELSRRFGCSRFHLSRTFRRIAGLSLRRYLARLRACLAAERLAEGVSDLTNLALELGYFDHSHFTNAFRNEWGHAPSRFRSRHLLSRFRSIISKPKKRVLT